MTAQHGHDEHAGHPQPAEYIKIAVVLTIITAIEVALFYIGEAKDGAGHRMIAEGLVTTAIMVLSALKFAIVVMWYMHLKFDHKLFSYFMVGGLALAGLVMLALLALLPILHLGSEL